MVERIHRQMKAALCARGGASNWADQLPWVLLGMRAAPREECGISAAEATLQHQLVLPGQLTPPTDKIPEHFTRKEPLAVIPPTKRSYAQVAQSSTLDQAQWVYIRKGGTCRPLANKWSGPYKVKEKGNKVWKLLVGDRLEVVSVDRLQAHQGAVDPEAAQPPQRGRPRKT